MQLALTNLERLLADAELHDAEIVDLEMREEELCRFQVELDGQHVDVWMPDIPLQAVRFLSGDPYPPAAPGSTMPPRVTVNGSDWSWPYAVESVAGWLTGRNRFAGMTLREACAERVRIQHAWRDLSALL